MIKIKRKLPRFRKNGNGNKKQPVAHRKALFEAIEPRILL